VRTRCVAEPQVCFQAYTSSLCNEVQGPKECAPQRNCVHVDQQGTEESTIQQCFGNHTVELQLFRGTTSCDLASRLYGVNITTGVCTNLGGYFGIMTCGKYTRLYLCLYVCK
jgi:hypothetical protein